MYMLHLKSWTTVYRVAAIVVVIVTLQRSADLLAASGQKATHVSSLPTIPYGAVYFRKSNPPREDWERDYAQAAKDNMNAFRHWFLWTAEPLPQRSRHETWWYWNSFNPKIRYS